MQKKIKNNKNQASKGIMVKYQKDTNAVVTTAPVAQATKRRTNKPKIQNSRDSTRISHREYISDILSTTDFSVNQFNINPGLNVSFPWLSQIATRYESYVMNKLSYCFETSSPTSVDGTLILAIDYDASDPAPLNKTQVLSYKSAVRCAPWQNISMVAEPSDMHKRKTLYSRSGILATSEDIKLYDIGTLNVCTMGTSDDDKVMGELYVVYDITLLTPQIDHDQQSLKIVGADTITSAQVFGLAPVLTGSLPLKSFLVGTNQIWILPVGDYLVNYVITGTGLVNNGAIVVASTVTATRVDSLVLAAGTELIDIIRVRITDSQNGMFYLDSAGSFTTVSACTVYITPCIYTDM